MNDLSPDAPPVPTFREALRFWSKLGWISFGGPAGQIAIIVTTWVTFLPCFLFVFLGAPHVEGLRERPALASALTAITAAVVGVILNLAIVFATHALQPAAGVFDYFVAVVALAAWLAMERFKIGVIPTLAACAVLGVIWKLAF